MKQVKIQVTYPGYYKNLSAWAVNVRQPAVPDGIFLLMPIRERSIKKSGEISDAALRRGLILDSPDLKVRPDGARCWILRGCVIFTSTWERRKCAAPAEIIPDIWRITAISMR